MQGAGLFPLIFLRKIGFVLQTKCLNLLPLIWRKMNSLAARFRRPAATRYARLRGGQRDRHQVDAVLGVE
jgi:hypothetical protein